MVLSVHGHLSTARRHPPTVALPASSSGTREPRFGISMHRPHFHGPRPKLFPTPRTRWRDSGILFYLYPRSHVHVPWGSELCYYLLPIGGTDARLPGDGPLGAKLGSLPPSRFTRFHCCFQSRCGCGTRTVQPGLRNEVPLWIFWESGSLGVWNPDNIRGTILGRESGGSLESTTTTYCFRLSSAGLMRSCSMQPSRTRQN